MKNKGAIRYIKLLILCLGGVAIYLIPYLRWTYYDTLLEASGLNNTQFGIVMSVYGTAAFIFYAPGGIIADKLPVRKVMSIGLIIMGGLGLVFSTFPGYGLQLVIYFLWGVVATLLFWSAMMKATRQLGSSKEQGKLFGLLEGGRGLINFGIAAVGIYAFSKMGQTVAGLRGIIIVFSLLNFVAAILILVFFKEEDVEETTGPKMELKDIGKILKMPSVWLIGLIVITCYSIYLGCTYLTPYFTNVIGATATLAAVFAVIRSNVMQFAGGPCGGILADKMKSVVKTIIICFVVILVAVIAMILLPASSSMMIPLLVIMIVLCAGIFAMRGVYFAATEEVHIPLNVMGTAVGVISVIGFLPDVYMSAFAGRLLDLYPGAKGYQYLFISMLVFAVIGLVSAIILQRYAKKRAQVKKGVQWNN